MRDRQMDDSCVVNATSSQPAVGNHDHTLGWVELRDAAGKLKGKWDPAVGVREIQWRGMKMRYQLVGAWYERTG